MALTKGTLRLPARQPACLLCFGAQRARCRACLDASSAKSCLHQTLRSTEHGNWVGCNSLAEAMGWGTAEDWPVPP